MDFDPTPFSLAYGVASWIKLVGGISAIAIILSVILSFARNGASGGAARASRTR